MRELQAMLMKSIIKWNRIVLMTSIYFLTHFMSILHFYTPPPLPPPGNPKKQDVQKWKIVVN